MEFAFSDQSGYSRTIRYNFFYWIEPSTLYKAKQAKTQKVLCGKERNTLNLNRIFAEQTIVLIAVNVKL